MNPTTSAPQSSTPAPAAAPHSAAAPSPSSKSPVPATAQPAAQAAPNGGSPPPVVVDLDSEWPFEKHGADVKDAHMAVRVLGLATRAHVDDLGADLKKDLGGIAKGIDTLYRTGQDNAGRLHHKIEVVEENLSTKVGELGTKLATDIDNAKKGIDNAKDEIVEVATKANAKAFVLATLFLVILLLGLGVYVALFLNKNQGMTKDEIADTVKKAIAENTKDMNGKLDKVKDAVVSSNGTTVIGGLDTLAQGIDKTNRALYAVNAKGCEVNALDALARNVRRNGKAIKKVGDGVESLSGMLRNAALLKPGRGTVQVRASR
jgi:ribosomal protein S6